MPVAANDIKFYKSSGPNSNGGTINTGAELTGALAELFPSDPFLGGAIDTYRKIFVKNTHGSSNLVNVKLWASETSSPDDTIYLQLGDSSDTSPSGTWVQPVYGTALTFTLNYGEAQGIWLKRTVNATGTPTLSTSTLSIEGQST